MLLYVYTVYKVSRCKDLLDDLPNRIYTMHVINKTREKKISIVKIVKNDFSHKKCNFLYSILRYARSRFRTFSPVLQMTVATRRNSDRSVRETAFLFAAGRLLCRIIMFYTPEDVSMVGAHVYTSITCTVWPQSKGTLNIFTSAK